MRDEKNERERERKKKERRQTFWPKKNNKLRLQDGKDCCVLRRKQVERKKKGA